MTLNVSMDISVLLLVCWFWSVCNWNVGPISLFVGLSFSWMFVLGLFVGFFCFACTDKFTVCWPIGFSLPYYMMAFVIVEKQSWSYKTIWHFWLTVWHITWWFVCFLIYVVFLKLGKKKLKKPTQTLRVAAYGTETFVSCEDFSIRILIELL